MFRSYRASLAGRSPSLLAAYGQSTNPSAEAVLKLSQERIASQRPSSTRAQSDRRSRGLVLGAPQLRFPPLRTPSVQPRRHIMQSRRIGSGRVRRHAPPEIPPRHSDGVRPNGVCPGVTQRPLLVNLIQPARKKPGLPEVSATPGQRIDLLATSEMLSAALSRADGSALADREVRFPNDVRRYQSAND